jgi:outer membrane receptor protein involved in Fe transport
VALIQRTGRFAALSFAVAVGMPAGQVSAQSGADIVVTGERIERPLAATTSSVVVLTEEDARARGLSRFSDLVERAGNIAPVYGAGGFSIRGVSNIGVSNAGEAPTANVYLDDIPLAPTFLHGAPTEFWDIRQVEVWRGPQATLRGQNALAGAVIIETADPNLERWEARGVAALSDEAERRFALAGGGPIVGGELAARIALSVTRRDGFIRNLTRGGREDQEARDMLRGKLLWQPSALPSLAVELGYSHFRRRGGYLTTYARTDRPDYFADRVATDNVPNRTAVDFGGLTGQVRYALAPHISLVGTTTWSKVSETSQFDGDFGPENLAYSDQTRRYETVTQELRVALTGHALSGVAGLYYFDRNLASRTLSRTQVATPISTIASLLQAGGFPAPQAAAAAAVYGAALPAIPVDFEGSFPTEVRTAAAFADLRLRLTPRLSLLSGLRIDHFYGKNGTIQDARFVGTYPNPGAYGPLAPVIAQINMAVGGFVAQANGSVAGSGQSSTNLLPKAGLLMEWNESLSTSFVAQRAYRPGGQSVNIARGLTFPYESEFAWNFELGLRSRLFGGRLRLDANAYLMRWRNQQVTVNFGLNSFDTATINAGSSRLFGAEMEASWQVRSGLAVRGSAAYARTKFDSFQVAQLGGQSDLSGSEFAFAPRWTLAAGADVRLKSGISGSVSISHSTRAYGAVGANQEAYRTSPRTLLDARVGYDGGHWSAFVSARNLLDDKAVLYKSPVEPRAVLGTPRTVAFEFLARY